MEVVVLGDRVALRPWRPEDADGLVELWSDGRVMRYVGFPNGLTVNRERALKLIARARAVKDVAEDYYRFTVTLRETGEFLGEAAVGRISPEGETLPDVKLLPRHWGKGYGTDVVRLIVSFTFTFTKASRIALQPHVENIGARKAYSRAGFRQVGEEKRLEFDRPDVEPKGTAPVIYHDFVLTREDYLESTRLEGR